MNGFIRIHEREWNINDGLVKENLWIIQDTEILNGMIEIFVDNKRVIKDIRGNFGRYGRRQERSKLGIRRWGTVLVILVCIRLSIPPSLWFPPSLRRAMAPL